MLGSGNIDVKNILPILLGIFREKEGCCVVRAGEKGIVKKVRTLGQKFNNIKKKLLEL